MSTAVSYPASEALSLRWLSETLGSAEDVASAAAAAETCLSAALGSSALVVLSQPDGSDGIEVVWSSADRTSQDGLGHEADRREAFRTGRPIRVRQEDRADGLVAMLPLSCHGAAVGVLEVHAATRGLEGAWDVLEAVADLLGPALHGIGQQRHQETGKLQLASASAAASTPGADLDGREDELDLRLAWTAHELRGPISALRAALGFLGEQELTATHKALLDQCMAELDTMSTLVDETQHWGAQSHPPRGDEPISRTDCEVVGVVRSAIEQARLASGDDRVALEAPRRVLVPVDPVQLRSAVGNLLRNALAYSPVQTPVEVAVAADADTAVITVRNAGRASSDGDPNAIFRPFVRGANIDGRDGMGLGLFIARRVAETNGGRLTLHLHDEITEFRLEIPRGSG